MSCAGGSGPFQRDVSRVAPQRNDPTRALDSANVQRGGGPMQRARPRMMPPRRSGATRTPDIPAGRRCPSRGVQRRPQQKEVPYA